MTGDITHERLHFAYATEPPSLEELTVKRIVPVKLLGEPGAVAVLGESHYVSLPQVGYHELCSCAPLDLETDTVELNRGNHNRFAFSTANVEAATYATVNSLSAFPGPDPADIAYRFGNDAYTTIKIGESGTRYETFHTYPENGIALRTVTTLTPTFPDQ